MKSTFLRVCCIGLAVCATVPAFGQEDEEADIPIEYLRPLYNSLSFGVRARSTGPKVRFGNLGSIPRPPDPAAQANVNRQYDDGFVGSDASRAEETGAIMSSDNLRYRRDDRNNETGVAGSDGIYDFDRLAYVAGQTRNWGYGFDSQRISSTQVAMHMYGAESDGDSIEAQGGSEGGFDLQFSRDLGGLGKRMRWGFLFGTGLTDLNVKAAGTIQATLHTLTDTYSVVNGSGPTGAYVVPAAPYISSFPNNVPAQDYTPPQSGAALIVNGQEITTPLRDAPDSRTLTQTVNGATIDGNWQVKGAYYMLRLGPTISYRFTPRFGVSASAGVAAAYVGTRFIAHERPQGLNVTDSLEIDEEKEDKKVLTGFYGQVSAEIWVTSRTGFFAGAMYEQVGDYRQKLRGRTADVDLDTGAGFRFGMITRF